MTDPDPPSEQLTPEDFIKMAAAGRRLHRDHLARVAAAYAAGNAAGNWRGWEEAGILWALLRAVEMALLEAVDASGTGGNSDVRDWVKARRR